MMAIPFDRRGDRPSGPVRAISVAGKVPPHDMTAEGTVLSACLDGGAAIVAAVRLVVTPDDFYADRHRTIFEACLELEDAGGQIDVPSVAVQLMGRDEYDRVGGREYLVDVLNSSAAQTSETAQAAARIVVGLARQRSLLAKMQEAEARLYLGVPPDEFHDLTREVLSELGAIDERSTLRPVWESLVRPVPPEWCLTPPPARTWLLRDGRTGCGSLPLGKAGMLLAEGGAGKTTLLCQLALSVASGEPFLDWFDVQSPGRVLLVMGEEERDDMQRQIHRAATARGSRVDPDRIVVIPLHGVPCAMIERDRDGNVRDTDFAKWLFAFVREQVFSLVVLDPISRFAGLEAETDNAQATRYVQSTERLGSLCGATVLNSHHTNKTSRGGGSVGSSAARGSSAFTDGHRWVATMAIPDANLEEQADRVGEVVTLSFSKNNYERKGAPIYLRRTRSGALEPLDENDASLVRRVQSGDAGRQTKREQRSAELDERQRERAAAEAHEREVRDAAATKARRARDEADDAAVVELRKELPMATTRELVARLKVVRACGGTRAHDAVTRGTLSRTWGTLSRSGPPVPAVPAVPDPLTGELPA